MQLWASSYIRIHHAAIDSVVESQRTTFLPGHCMTRKLADVHCVWLYALIQTVRDLEMLNFSYLSLEGNIQEQLKRVLASADEASANSYRLLSERFRELTEAKVGEIQRAYNSHRLDELAADRSILDMINQLRSKGVAVLDISDVFPGHGFEAVRKELMVRVAKRVKAFL